MITMGCDELQIVRESIDGRRPMDQDTVDSIGVLSDRLERLRGFGSFYSQIEFSPDVQRLTEAMAAV